MADISENDTYCKGEDYFDKFDPSAHLQYYDDVRGTLSEHRLRHYHDIFHTLPKNITVLEHGSGPTLLSTISAATKASEIVLSDYSDANLQALRLWLHTDMAAFDWSPHFSFVVEELEGKGEEEVVERQEQVRKLVKAVVHCDLTQDPPIDKDYDKLYDVVISSMVVECIAQNYDEYNILMSRLSKLVKPGGLLLLYGVENNEFYTVGDFTFKNFPISSEMAMAAVKNAGFADVSVDKFVFSLPTIKTRTFMFIKSTRVQ